MSTKAVIIILNIVSLVIIMKACYILFIKESNDYFIETACVMLDSFSDDSSNICANNNTYDVIVIVMSSIQNKNNRDAVRATWGNITYYEEIGLSVKVLFVVGIEEMKDTSISTTFYREQLEHKDFLRVRVKEDYHNIVFKHMFALFHLSQHCSESTILIKTDDDVFVDVEQIYRLYYQHLNKTGPFWCNLLNGPPIRDPQNEDKPIETVQQNSFPNYCMGSFYAVKMQTIQSLARVMQCYPYSWVDDFHITGELRRVAQVPLVPLSENSQLVIKKKIPLQVFELWAENSKMRLVYHHMLSSSMMKVLWRIFRNREDSIMLPTRE